MITSHGSISYYSIISYRRYAKADGPWGIGIGLAERFSVRILASPRTYIYMRSTVPPSVIISELYDNPVITQAAARQAAWL